MLDSRLQLTACSTPVSVLPDSNQRVLGHVTVGLRDAPERWTIHVRGNVSAQRELPTLVRAINRGDIIGPRDVAWQTVQINREPSGYDVPADIVGKEARKHLTVGQTLRSSDVIAPTLIERGNVDVISQTAGLQVAYAGQSLNSWCRGRSSHRAKRQLG